MYGIDPMGASKWYSCDVDVLYKGFSKFDGIHDDS